MKRLYFQTEEVITKTKKGYVEIEDSYTQVYDNLLSLSFKMKGATDTSLMFFLFKQSTKVGVFSTNQHLYDQFCTDSVKAGKLAVTRQAFNNSVRHLSDLKIIVRLSKGHYQLNPFLIWKDSSKEREYHIEQIMKSDNDNHYKVIEETTEYTVLPAKYLTHY